MPRTPTTDIQKPKPSQIPLQRPPGPIDPGPRPKPGG